MILVVALLLTLLLVEYVCFAFVEVQALYAFHASVVSYVTPLLQQPPRTFSLLSVCLRRALRRSSSPSSSSSSSSSLAAASPSPPSSSSPWISLVSLTVVVSLSSFFVESLCLSLRSLGSLHLSSLCPFPTHFSILSCDHYCRNEHLCTDDLSSIQTWVVDLGFLFVPKSSKWWFCDAVAPSTVCQIIPASISRRQFRGINLHHLLRRRRTTTRQEQEGIYIPWHSSSKDDQEWKNSRKQRHGLFGCSRCSAAAAAPDINGCCCRDPRVVHVFGRDMGAHQLVADQAKKSSSSSFSQESTTSYYNVCCRWVVWARTTSVAGVGCISGAAGVLPCHARLATSSLPAQKNLSSANAYLHLHLHHRSCEHRTHPQDQLLQLSQGTKRWSGRSCCIWSKRFHRRNSRRKDLKKTRKSLHFFTFFTELPCIPICMLSFAVKDSHAILSHASLMQTLRF